MLTGNMRDHLIQIIQKIIKGDHFGIIRPGDGEYFILTNRTFTSQPGDDWTHTSNSILREHLMNSVKTINPNLFIGIPCNTCCGSTSNIYDMKIPKSQLTYANVFCNSNWKFFLQFLRSYKKGFYLITCGTTPCNIFPIKERMYIDKFLVNKWDTVWEPETARILDYIREKNGELICFASGPLSKIWIPKCMEINPNNVYLDIGSALDYYTKGTTNARPYTNPSSQYSKECCSFST